MTDRFFDHLPSNRYPYQNRKEKDFKDLIFEIRCFHHHDVILETKYEVWSKSKVQYTCKRQESNQMDAHYKYEVAIVYWKIHA